jgi:predicted transcriptional regulator
MSLANQRPCTLMKIVIVEEYLIREDRRVRGCEIVEITGIAKSTVHEIISDLRFEDFMVVTMKNAIFWNVMLCGSYKSHMVSSLRRWHSSSQI